MMGVWLAACVGFCVLTFSFAYFEGGVDDAVIEVGIGVRIRSYVDV
jgi:folylpolyglutamate synthase/dihydropteroate synthase